MARRGCAARVEIGDVRYGLSRGLECGEGLDYPGRRLCIILFEGSVECMPDFGVFISRAGYGVDMVRYEEVSWTKLVSIHRKHMKFCC